MAKNDFLPFATADGANVLSAEDYQTLHARSNGFSAGVARSQELNTVWRQASVIAHVVAQFIADTNNSDVADDGDLQTLQDGLRQALSQHIDHRVKPASLTAAGITQLSSATHSDSETMAATPKAVKAVMDLAASSAVKSVNGKKGEVQLTASDVGALAQTGGTVNGPLTVEGKTQFTGELHANRGALFGGNLVVSWGGRSATFHENGDVTAPVWGGALSAWLHNQLRQSVPSGIPLPWPQQEAPAGWLKCNGAPFDKALHPLLAQAYPSGVLPDLRGEFIRGWDDGRGVDSGRVLQSEQGDTIRNITGSLLYGHDADVKAPTTNASTGATYYDTSEKLRDTENGLSVSVNYNYNWWYPAKLDASRVVPTSNEVRPRNVAFNYIVRAA